MHILKIPEMPKQFWLGSRVIIFHFYNLNKKNNLESEIHSEVTKVVNIAWEGSLTMEIMIYIYLFIL